MYRKTLCILLLLSLLLSGCSRETPENPSQGTVPNAAGTPQSTVADPSKLFTDRDLSGTYDASGSTQILFDGGKITAGASVTVSGSTATITQAGTYILRGSAEDGRVAVSVPKDAKVQLVLDGIDLTSTDGAAIHILQADKVFLTLAQGSVNLLANGGTFADAEETGVDAVIFSKEDLTINGTGSLCVTSPAGHGIVSKDDLTITGGTYEITTSAHGISGKDSICIADADVTIAAGKDGIQAEHDEDAALGYVYILDGMYHIDAQGDGISASSWLQVDGGTYEILTGGGYVNGEDHVSDNWGNMGGRPGGMGGGGRLGGRSAATDTAEDSSSIKGLKAGTDLFLNGGSFSIDSADDAIHSDGNVAVAGGVFLVSSGDDITISHSYEGLEGLNIAVSGGKISITSSDDGINAAGGTDASGFGGNRNDPFGGGFGMGGASNGSITVSGGETFIFAGGDGIDSNGSLTMSGGKLTIHGPTTGDTSVLDYDTTATISGGTFIGTGAMMMAQTFSASENQGLISVSVGGTVPAGTQITLTDAGGNTVLTVTPDQNFAIVILSTPQIVKGDNYTVTIGTASGTFRAE